MKRSISRRPRNAAGCGSSRRRTVKSGSVRVHQDVRVYGGLFDGAERADLELAPGRRAYVHVARGAVHANGVELSAGDALKLWDEPRVADRAGRQGRDPGVRPARLRS